MDTIFRYNKKRVLKFNPFKGMSKNKNGKKLINSINDEVVVKRKNY